MVFFLMDPTGPGYSKDHGVEIRTRRGKTALTTTDGGHEAEAKTDVRRDETPTGLYPHR